MAIWAKPMQLKTGNWGYVEVSDEDETILHELCKCENGHPTPEEAKECAAPIENVLNKFSKDDVIKGLFELECEKLDLNPDGLILLFQIEFVKMARNERNN